MVDFAGMTMVELIDYYNTKAAFMDRPTVKKFADRKTAERRCAQIAEAISGVANAGKTPEAEASKEDISQAEVQAGEKEASEAIENTIDLESETAPAAEGETQENDMTAKKTKKATAKKTGRTHGPKDGKMVGTGTNREKLLALFTKHKGQQVSISEMMKAVYGKAQKDFKGPVMMVMKGLLIVFKTQKKPWEIRKTRENKENYFGLYNKSDK